MVRSHLHIEFVATAALTIALAVVNISAFSSVSRYEFENDTNDTTIHIVKTPTDGGIKEEVPTKYRERFEKWKSELLATDRGRAQ